ncbi:hypothetical protein A2U01_0089026, partial [Trifolium medium]|nr:hypothetical protein [Trifolium medium]
MDHDRPFHRSGFHHHVTRRGSSFQPGARTQSFSAEQFQIPIKQDLDTRPVYTFQQTGLRQQLNNDDRRRQEGSEFRRRSREG